MVLLLGVQLTDGAGIHPFSDVRALRSSHDQAVTVRATFFNAAGDNLDDVEDAHFSRLVFDPAGTATATMDPSAHYSHEVIVNVAAPATGTLMVDLGHDAAADEHSLGPIDVVVE